MVQSGSILLTGIGELATPLGRAAAKGRAMGELRVVRDAALLAEGGTIAYTGPASGLPHGAGRADTIVNAGGRAVVPGFVDSHTHFLFGGYRDDEFLWRAQGLPYMEIHKRGGGIRRSVEATRAAGKEALLAIGRKRLAAMPGLGITTVEGKSGYGLDMDTEILQLSVMAELSASQCLRVVPTFMGLHSLPPEYQGRKAEYLDFVIDRVLPRVAELGLARFADVFCEEGVFDLAESERYLLAARKLGLGLKLHADEIVRIGGAGLAARLGAVSADHLLKASEEDLAAMAKAGVVATCLPLTAFTLREPYANARAMIDAGGAVAMASDLNPGSCYSQSLPLAFALAVLYMGLSMEETLCAWTLNGAAALGLAAEIGSLETGKKADFLVLDAPSFSHLAYHTGMNIVAATWKDGLPVHDALGISGGKSR